MMKGTPNLSARSTPVSDLLFLILSPAIDGASLYANDSIAKPIDGGSKKRSSTDFDS
jgi:hypothetical protein